MLISDFNEEFPQFVNQGDFRNATNTLMYELGNILATNKKDFVELLNQSDINASLNDSNLRLINLFVSNVGENKKLSLGASLLIHVNNKEVNFDGNSEISDESVKCAYGLMNSYFSGDDEGYSNAIDPVTAIAEGVGKIAGFGQTIAQGQQKKKYGALDLASKQQEARSMMSQKLLELKQSQIDSAKKQQEGKSKTTRTLLIVGGVILGLAVIGGIFYVIKKRK